MNATSDNPWGISFMAMFHMANDSGLFRTAAQLAAEGARRDGPNWVGQSGEVWAAHRGQDGASVRPSLGDL